jgi:hypothetical protein
LSRRKFFILSYGTEGEMTRFAATGAQSEPLHHIPRFPARRRHIVAFRNCTVTLDGKPVAFYSN